MHRGLASAMGIMRDAYSKGGEATDRLVSSYAAEAAGYGTIHA
jgi:hypothetical protein